MERPLDRARVLGKLEVPEHQDGGEKEGRRVGAVGSGDAYFAVSNFKVGDRCF